MANLGVSASDGVSASLRDITRIIIDHGVITIDMTDKSNRATGIVKVGPCGGHKGEPKDMTPDDVNRITKMIIRHGGVIDSIYFVYQFNNGSQDEKRFGGEGGQKAQIYFSPDEYITNVSGHYGVFNGSVVVRSLKIETNHHQGLDAYGPFGVAEGLAFNLPAYGGKIVGFHGGAGTYLNALGVYVRHY